MNKVIDHPYVVHDVGPSAHWQQWRADHESRGHVIVACADYAECTCGATFHGGAAIRDGARVEP